ncbi:MAG: hypothetical protein HRT69_05460 [Flavobacteriaceae bacterium]|nr:hypothetical protein [Flavobacteriaceae bacterium]
MLSSQNKVALLFPDGVGIKNYLYTELFQQTDAELVLLHNFDPATISAIKKQTTFVDTIEIPTYKESVREKFLRELICLSRLHYNAQKVLNNSLLTNWKTNHIGVKQQVFYKAIAIVAPFFKHYYTILFLEKQYQKSIRKNKFYKQMVALLQQLNPTSLFCSHQRGVKAATIFAAANDLGIQTSTVIYSWDNLPKARLALRADNYLVWSDYMKVEMSQFYPEINQDTVFATGTPQFECYADKNNIIEKDSFYKRYKLSLDKKIICFSGDDIKTSPDDPKYLADIAAALLNANLENQYQILFRRCPVDVSDRFDAVLQQYSDVIKVAAPLWNFNADEHWTTIYPLKDDVKLLVSTAYYSAIVVNVGSTMAFDFSMYNKPCVFINYDQEHQNEVTWSVDTIYSYQHFKSMPSKNAVIWLNNKSEIIEVLTGSYPVNKEMDKWKKIVLGNYKNATSQIKLLLKI